MYLIRSLTVALLLWCVTGVAQGKAAAQSPAAPAPGVFAVTGLGSIELSVFGERAFVAYDMNPKVFYPPGSFDRIAAADDIQAFVVNMAGWAPRELYMVVGRKRLSSPFQKNARLVGRVLSKGTTLIQVVSEGFDLPSLQRDYLRLLSRNATGEDAEAFVVLELKNRDDLNDRSYPLRIRLASQAR
jgi:hypothetical protein